MTDQAPLLLHIFPSFAVGGAQVRFAAIANHFGSAFRHIVVSLDGDWSCRVRLAPNLNASFPEVTAPKHAMLTNAWHFRHLLRQWRPSLLITHNWGAIEWAASNCLGKTRHLHIEDGFGPEERAQQLPRRVLMRRLLLWRSRVVLPSRKLYRIATEIWRLPRHRVRYIPNGIALGRFAPRETPARQVPVIGTVTALRAEKNVARLLRAFALLEVPARLVLVGDGPERASLQSLAQSLQIAEHVEFAGQVADPAPLYSGFDVFALSSDTEQMPLSLMEAMAVGLPVATTDVGDVRAMLSDSNAPFVGGLYESHLARSLTTLLLDAGLRQQIGVANRVKAQAEFDEQAMFRAYGALWRGEAIPG